MSAQGHTAEIVSLNFNQHGDQIITGSFDHTVKIWDTRTGRCIHTLAGHHGEISSTSYNYTGNLCVSGSIDRTCKIWDIGKGTCVQTLRGHNDEILDVAFNYCGTKVCANLRCCCRTRCGVCSYVLSVVPAPPAAVAHVCLPALSLCSW